VLVFEALPEVARHGRGVRMQALAEQLIEALGRGLSAGFGYGFGGF
jgi:hypothetical protein